MHLAPQASLRAALRRREDCETVVPFLAAFSTRQLMAYEAEQGLYARSGFDVASEIVFVSLPA